MNYLEYTFSGFSDQDNMEILMAMLDDAGYSGFLENRDQVIAYIKEDLKNEALLDRIIQVLKGNQDSISYTARIIPKTNWNEQWERSFQPVSIDDQVMVRAAFHKSSGIHKYDVVIEPKMSFGTGHHETTRLMIRAMLKTELKDRRVLDMGCGTGILGIIACKLGCNSGIGVDIDEWAVENSIENARSNNCSRLEFRKGNISVLINESFQLILANINRNILLEDMHHYSEMLSKGGVLILSGIMEQDESDITAEAEKCNLEFHSRFLEKSWLALTFNK